MMKTVTPLAGVWIEIDPTFAVCIRASVTPLAGVWIEILMRNVSVMAGYSHSPCGSVD